MSGGRRGAWIGGWLAVLLPLQLAASVHRSGDYQYELTPPPEFVQSAQVAEQWPQALVQQGSNDSWRNWLSDDQLDWRTAPARHYRDYAIQALSTETLGHAAQLRIDFDPSWQKLSLHRLQLRREGEWQERLNPASITLARREQNFESKIYDGQVTALIVVDDVRIGDVVRLSYTLEGSHPVLAGYGMPGFTFGASDPMVLRQVRVLAPADPGLNLMQTDPVVQVRQQVVGDHVELSAQRRDVAGLRYADQVPGWEIQTPALFVAIKRDWGEIARWAAALYPAEPPSAAMRAAVARIRATHATPLEQVRAALTLTQDEVRYFGMEFGASTHQPAAPGLVLERRFGDCKDKSRLLVSLLTDLGIEAVPALVDTDYMRLLDQLPPAGGAFDHVIVMASIDGRRYWLDPTDTMQHGPLDDLGFPDFERALLVQADTSALTIIQPPREPRDAVEVEETVVALDGRAAELKVVSAWHGGLAEYIRRSASGNGHQTMSENYRQFYTRTYGDASSLSPLKVEDDPDHNTVVVSEHYRIENFYMRDGDSGHAEFYAQAVSQFISLPNQMDRAASLLMRHPLKVSHRVQIQLPEGARTYSTGSSTSQVQDPAWEFSFGTSRTERSIGLDYQYRSRTRVVEKDAVRAHLKQRRELIDLLSRRMAFRWQGDLAAEREARLQALLDELDRADGDAR